MEHNLVLTEEEKVELTARPIGSHQRLTTEQAGLRLALGKKIWAAMHAADTTMPDWARAAYAQAPPWQYYLEGTRLRRVYGVFTKGGETYMWIVGFTLLGAHDCIDGVRPADLRVVDYNAAMAAVGQRNIFGNNMHWFTDPLGFMDVMDAMR
jgi:hypothetical protein